MVSAVELSSESFRPLRREEYERLAELGAFADEKVELLRGVIVRMSPQGVRHAGVIQKLNQLLVRAIGERGEVRVQLPLAASDDSEPEPDLAVVAPGSPWQAHPSSALLVVEVAESSLPKDRSLKGELYAAALVPEYWVVDVHGCVVEVYRDPARGRYSSLRSSGRGEAIELSSVPGVRLDVAAFLPPE